MTRKVIDDFRKTSKIQDGIIYLYQGHKGVSEARNFGIINSRADLIAFIDDDDRWEKDKLELQVKAMTRNTEVSFSYTNSFFVYQNLGAKILQSRIMNLGEGDIFEQLLYKCFIITSSVMAKKAALLEAGLFDKAMSVGEDWDLWLRLAYKHKVGYLREPLLNYNLHGDNSHKDTLRMLEGHRRIIEKIFYSNRFVEYKKMKTASELNFYLTAAEAYIRRKCYLQALKKLFSALLFMRPGYLWAMRRLFGICLRFFIGPKIDFTYLRFHEKY
jgi:glycosyltransferase involved in cell wall biosynthesis